MIRERTVAVPLGERMPEAGGEGLVHGVAGDEGVEVGEASNATASAV
jgi:hypothetical protein